MMLAHTWTIKTRLWMWTIWWISVFAMFLSYVGIDGNETDRLLQHVPTTFGLITLFYAIRRQVLSPIALISIFVFLWIHIVGARYLYSYVPYDTWCQQVLGFSLNTAMGWDRNMYDRLVHYSFGALGVWPTYEFLRHRVGLTSRQAIYFSVEFVMAIGMLYELIEFAIAMQFSPEEAENYNGQQGDMWDAQKDMLIATVGALVTLIMIKCAQLIKRRIA